MGVRKKQAYPERQINDLRVCFLRAKSLDVIDSNEIVKFVRSLDKPEKPDLFKKRLLHETPRELPEGEQWREKLSMTLMQKLARYRASPHGRSQETGIPRTKNQ